MSDFGARNPSSPIRPGERIELLDALRGFALFGILIINMRSFTGWEFMTPEVRAGFASPLDHAVLLLHDAFFRGKFYTLFSLLFGIGIAMQLSRAASRAGAFLPLYRRRLWILLAFGLLHMTFLWEGDILALYAVCGFALLLFRGCADRTLLRWALVFVLLPVPVHTLMLLSGGSFNPGGALVRFGNEVWAGLGYTEEGALAVLAEGGWRDIFYWNVTGPIFRVGGLLFESRQFKVLGVFLVGLWAGRWLIAGRLPSDWRLLRRVVLAGLAIGLPANVAFVWLQPGAYSTEPTAQGLLLTVIYALAVAPLGLAYAAGFALLWQRPRWQRAFGVFAPAGRMALTTYLSQTLIGLSFYGIGFGIVGRLGPADWTLLTVAIFGAQVVASTVWLRRFRYGPAEWLWRRLTYGESLPMSVRPGVVVSAT